jgi:hypothetical protein
MRIERIGGSMRRETEETVKKSTFAVGRATRKSTLVLFVGVMKSPSPILGPWTVRAVVSTN